MRVLIRQCIGHVLRRLQPLCNLTEAADAWQQYISTGRIQQHLCVTHWSVDNHHTLRGKLQTYLSSPELNAVLFTAVLLSMQRTVHSWLAASQVLAQIR